MLDVLAMERLRQLAGSAGRGTIKPDEKGEVRSILARAAPAAQDLAWPDVLQVAYMFLGVYSIGRLAAETAAADAS
ncbi:MAG: hypothetical protein AABY18_02525 [Candidatus Thermoplasmatota archaeon]